MFTQMGVFRLKPGDWDPEEVELELIDHGLEEMGEGTNEDGDPVFVLRCAFNDFGPLHAGPAALSIEPDSTGAEWIPQNLIDLDEAQAEEVLKLVDALEQDDDVQNVFHNLK